MDGILAAAVSLVAYSNEYLCGGMPHPPRLLETLSAYTIAVRGLQFWTATPNGPRNLDLDVWLPALRQRGVSRLRLVYVSAIPGSAAAAGCEFAHGRRTAVLESDQKACRLWWARWEAELNARRRPWSVDYRAFDPEGSGSLAPVSLDHAEQALTEVIDAVDHVFTNRFAPEDWEVVRLLRDAMRGGDLTPPYYPDIVPPGRFSRRARELLVTAMKCIGCSGLYRWDSVPSSAEARREMETLGAALYHVSASALCAALDSADYGV